MAHKNTLLELFKTIYPNLEADNLKGLIQQQKIWRILFSIDLDYFERVQRNVEDSMAGILEAVGKYITSTFAVYIKTETMVRLAENQDWTWGTLLLYLMIMSDKRQQTISIILDYDANKQTFFMQLISQTEQNFTQVQQEQPQCLSTIDQGVIRKIQELQAEIEQLKSIIQDKNQTIEGLRQDLANMKMAQQSLQEVEDTLKTQQYQLLDTIGVNNFDDLIFNHSSIIKQNDKLKDLLDTRDEELKNFKQMYYEASMNLDSLLTSVQQQQNFTPQQQTQLQRRRSTILSKKSLTYIQNIEMHCKPLLQDIAMLEKRNRLLEKQIKLLYKNFKILLKQLKPCRQWGLLEDVPRVIF